MKILVVDDEVSLASFIKKGLEAESFSTDIAYDGYVGKQLFQKNWSTLFRTGQTGIVLIKRSDFVGTPLSILKLPWHVVEGALWRTN